MPLVASSLGRNGGGRHRGLDPGDKDDPRSEAGGTDRSFSRMEGFPGNTMSPSRSASTAPPAGCSTGTAAGSCSKQAEYSSASEGSFLPPNEYLQRRCAADAHASLPSPPTHIAPADSHIHTHVNTHRSRPSLTTHLHSHARHANTRPHDARAHTT